jgi:predicted negative regulator of RcsB-dependent stress response
MRLNINLASQKFEDVRKFYMRWGTAIVLTFLLTLALAFLAWKNYSDSGKSSARIQEHERAIAALQKERAEAEAVSNLAKNHDVTAQKDYWNRQIARRAFSWTQLFNDLQRIMPARAYVNSVRPEITQDNRLKLSLEIAGDKHDNALELVQRMEKSESFRGPRIKSDVAQKDPRSGSTLYKLEIETYYTPAGVAQRTATRRGL